MNKIELLDQLYEGHTCSNCSNLILCDKDSDGVCENWTAYDDMRFHDMLMKARAKIEKDIKRGTGNWIA